MASEGLHEPAELLSEQTIDRHRAIVSLMEELEAIDWYDQRIEATTDPELRAVLIHNRDEEKEHAAMTLEWLRRRDPVLDRELRDWLFTTRFIGADEDHSHDHGPPGGGGSDDDGVAVSRAGPVRQGLGIGGLFGEATL